MNIGSESDFTFKICIIGDIGTGKSTMLDRLCNNIFHTNYSCTIGVDFKIHNVYLDDYNKNIKLQLWDTAGQEKFISIVRSYFRKMAGCIILYDVTNVESFRNIEKWIDELKGQCFKMPVIYIVGNKTDGDIQITNKMLNEFINNYKLNNNEKIYGLEISVKDNINIEELFYNITLNIYNNVILNDYNYEDYDIKKKNIYDFMLEDHQSNKKCCIIS